MGQGQCGHPEEDPNVSNTEITPLATLGYSQPLEGRWLRGDTEQEPRIWCLE